MVRISGSINCSKYDRCGKCLRLPCLSDFRPNRTITRLEKQQRLAASHNDIFNFGDENRVIACVLGSLQTALQVSQPALQDWSSLLRAIEFRSRFLFGADGIAVLSRIVLGNRALLF